MSSIPTPAPAPAPAPTAAPSRRRAIAAAAPEAAPTKVVYTEEQKKAFNAARQRFARGGSANATAEAHAFIAETYKTSGKTSKSVAVKAAPAARVVKAVKAVAAPAKSVAPRGRKSANVAVAAPTKSGRGRSQEIRPVRVAPAAVAGVTAPENATVVVSVFGSKKSFYPGSLKDWNQLGSTLFA